MGLLPLHFPKYMITESGLMKRGSSQEFVHPGKVVAGLDATFRFRLSQCISECT